MKHKLLHLFAIIFALGIISPNAFSQVPSYKFSTPTQVWKKDFATTNSAVNHEPGYYRQAAATDGKIWAVPGGSATATYPTYSGVQITYGHILGENYENVWSGGSKNEKMPYTSSGTYYYLGPAIASDDEGTLWCTSLRSSSAPSETPWKVGAQAFTYYIKRPVEGNMEGERVGLKLNGTGHETSGRADLMSVSGQGVNGIAYFWFAIAGTNKIECIVMEKAKTIRKLTFTSPVTFANDYVSGYVKQFAGSRLLLNPGGSKDQVNELYLGSISGSLYDGTATVTWDNPGPTGLMVSRYGSTAFLLNGHGIIVYSTSPTTIRVYDWTAQREIGTFKPFGESESGSKYVSHSMDVKVNGNTAELYIYSPGVGGAKYTITSSEINDPVSNLKASKADASSNNVTVTWNKPTQGTVEKYSVSYSSDGGSTWSTAEETSNLSHTFKDLPIGYYTFKVTPYYYFSQSSYKWGQEAISNSVPVGDFNPVSNVNVAYTGNLGNSIVVSWTKPEAGVAPNTYQVCYSSNNGTSWSNVVETTDLTYTFTDLTVGTYIFKVTPVYGSSLGEDSQSEVIEVIKTGITFTTTKLWESKGEIATADLYDSRGIAVSNNKAYIMAAKHTSAISYVDFDNKDRAWSSFETGFNAQIYGYAIDNDDSGNIIIQSAPRYGEAATQLTIYPAGATSNANKKNITLSGEYLPNSRADFFAAQGNLLSDEGGYLWMVPISDQKIIRLRIVNGNITGVDTWPQTFATSANQNQIIIRPLLDGRLYIHHRANEYKIINLPAPGTEITSNMIELLSTPTAEKLSYSYVGSDMFILQGHTFHVRNDGTKDKGIGIAIKNLTEKDKEGNGDATYTPFNGKDVNGADNGITGIAGYGSVVRAVKVNDYNYDVYSHSPNHGVTVYRVSAKASNIKTDKLSSLSYNYLESTDAEGNKVQDIKLTWEAPKDATPSKYKVYRDGSPLATVDASTLTYTDNGVTQNHTYKVVPIFTGVNEDAEHGLSVTTTEVESTEVESILYAPEITEIRNHDGYSIVEIFYKMPAESKTEQIAYYNIYRNGVLLETGLTQYNFIDDQLPKIDKAVDYTYIVEAVYKPEYDNATRTSKKETVTVKARDWSLSGYQLQEVYNIPISPEIGNLPNNFTNEEYYRQGHFYNGSWYIAQRADNLAKRDDPNYTASDKNTEIVSAKAGTTGGVVSIKAIEENDVLTGFTGKPITSEAFASVGLAIDDAGNVFMRHNNGSNADMATTAPAIDKITGLPVSWLTYIADGFTRRITRGAIYKRNEDGTYSTTPSVINLNPLWTSNDWINTMTCTYKSGEVGDKNGQVTGRSDYYYMYGDVMSAEGGYLLLSPSWTRTIFKVKIANGKYVNHETHELNQYQSKEGMVDVTVGTGNYGFRIDGRDAWIAQLRSSGYFGIHEENHEEGHKHEMHAIFVTDSRINNTGGTSIVAFNSAEGANDGETFLITPTNMHSRNYGDFIVTRGTKTNTTDPASEAKFMPPMPVAQIKQTNISENLATNASGNWFHAEVGTYESATGEQSECVYIYQYVPGIRFAKYRMVSDLTLPVVYPTLEIKTAYNDDETDITHFDGIVTWERPQGFGITNADEASVWIKSYTVELVDAKGNVVETVEVKSDVEDENGNCEFNYFEYLAGLGKLTSDCELDFQTYTARVAVNYELKNGDIQQSSFNYAIASNDYDAEKASDLAVHVFKKEKVTEYVWVENPNTTETTEDDWVAVPKEFDTYRVELDFNPPAWSADANPEPISYYTVKALVNNQTDLIEITDFHLHTGAEVVNGVEKATYEVASQIPGTYNFSQYNKGGNKAPYYHTVGKDYGVGGESRRAGVLTWHHKVDYGQYTGGVATTAEGDEIVITDEPNKWVFIVEAHYGAKNRYIAKSAEASIGVEDQKYIETGVEVVGDNTAALKIYPIPATTSITVKASEAINSIVIYNEAGVEVINEMGNGENITMVNIENLSTGFYFVKVNNYEPVKIIKK